jgi:hypothetical protein
VNPHGVKRPSLKKDGVAGWDCQKVSSNVKLRLMEYGIHLPLPADSSSIAQ